MNKLLKRKRMTFATLPFFVLVILRLAWYADEELYDVILIYDCNDFPGRLFYEKGAFVYSVTIRCVWLCGSHPWSTSTCTLRCVTKLNQVAWKFTECHIRHATRFSQLQVDVSLSTTSTTNFDKRQDDYTPYCKTIIRLIWRSIRKMTQADWLRSRTASFSYRSINHRQKITNVWVKISKWA